ncbi:MAG: Lrp/AsnC family transcriptional regulator, regulator for asnA, asnC and gidA [Thermococcaceae archaeon]|jgi:Lrp/AsnC family transcriptional regulator for asnA, asnC and gidA|nr:Lrp/AsnC family transcriptional regulator, regulator for asnA, asnC and gidA [Thermococcaceae archaeon]MDN5320700.1 Lrp/AsnC family transcriptional regulator, regulator for asnA, asnC and gidA [Thermococcaceae archaeon]
MVIDEIDEKILAILKENSRVSLTSLSKMLGITTPAIKYRLEKLEKTGIIKRYSIEVDYEKLGYGIAAFVGINIDPSKRKKVISELLNTEEVLKIYEVTGEYDLLLEIRALDVSSLRKFLTLKLGSIKGILRTYTMTIVYEYEPRRRLQ